MLDIASASATTAAGIGGNSNEGSNRARPCSTAGGAASSGVRSKPTARNARPAPRRPVSAAKGAASAKPATTGDIHSSNGTDTDQDTRPSPTPVSMCAA